MDYWTSHVLYACRQGICIEFCFSTRTKVAVGCHLSASTGKKNLWGMRNSCRLSCLCQLVRTQQVSVIG